jgi:hypothetical protein
MWATLFILLIVGRIAMRPYEKKKNFGKFCSG